MKKISKIMLFLLLSVFTFEGCSNLLDVDSNRLVFPNGYQMNASNDTLYSMFGIFSQMEKLADSYVLLGELRGDLMDVTPTSNLFLKEINNFDISGNNPYANNIKDYYSVINNCNYVIHNIDTSVVKGGVKVMYKEYAACKAIRAWTYMQIVLNYGSAIYYEKPVLTVEDAENIQKLSPLSLTELVPILVADIAPWKDIDMPSLGFLFNHNTSNSYFPIRFLLGDLYLWTGQYENAANEYHDLMYKNSYILNISYRNTRAVLNNAFTGNYTLFNFIGNSSENITNIAATNQYGQKFDLDSLTLNRMIAPSAVAITNWQKQKYFHSNTLDTLGDLRLLSSVVALSSSKFPTSNNNFTTSTKITETSNNFIYKYILLNYPTSTQKINKEITPYRVPLLYLRYAEAVNRLGKPNLAMAVLKNGLKNSSIVNPKIVPKNELSVPLPNYMDFGITDVVKKNQFELNIGVRMRGCGNVNVDTTYYKIPKLEAIQDSILYVEDLIQQELSLETAFEGNRFHDLMRIAIRRDNNLYLANLVSSKYNENKEAIRTKLSIRENWYLKK